jgi:hypothetical protein
VLRVTVADIIAYSGCRIGICSKDRDVSQLDASINGHVGCKYGTFIRCTAGAEGARLA